MTRPSSVATLNTNSEKTSSTTVHKDSKQNKSVVLKVENVSKKFCSNLKQSMLYGIKDLTKGLIGVKPNTAELRPKEFWALQDINFELRENETLGIIGVNGAGKSTLLRILTGIYPPDRGKVTIHGKVGGIIALGAGMHPHMTGRENIYLNGTILGLTKSEIDDLYDEIVDFAELEKFIDSPFSTYSSGMKVRLGFAVAVNVKPEVLLIDEVFSVGDIRFQSKCTQKIEELKSESSTIFISHSMRHVSRICSRVIMLENTKIVANGSPSEVIAYYHEKNLIDNKNLKSKEFYKDDNIEDVSIRPSYKEKDGSIVQIFEDSFETTIDVSSKVQFDEILLSLSFYNSDGVCVNFANNETQITQLKKGLSTVVCSFPKLRLLPGTYYIKIKIQSLKSGLIYDADTPTFKVIYSKTNFRPVMGVYMEDFNWRFYHDN